MARRRTPARSKAARKHPTKAAPTPVRLPRIAKGKKPQYFSDPAIDKLLWMTMTLMEELSVARDRIDTGSGLVENQNLGGMDQRDRQRDGPDHHRPYSSRLENAADLFGGLYHLIGIGHWSRLAGAGWSSANRLAKPKAALTRSSTVMRRTRSISA